MSTQPLIGEEDRVKKNDNKKRDRAQEKKPRRLTLSRETIQALDEPSLLELARGGGETGDSGGARCTSISFPGA
jgi:hypothetical protein